MGLMDKKGSEVPASMPDGTYDFTIANVNLKDVTEKDTENVTGWRLCVIQLQINEGSYAGDRAPDFFRYPANEEVEDTMTDNEAMRLKMDIRRASQLQSALGVDVAMKDFFEHELPSRLIGSTVRAAIKTNKSGFRNFVYGESDSKPTKGVAEDVPF